jgi:protein-tyrosine phosphatase
MENCNEICDNIFVGNKLSLENPHQYSLIINCTPSIPFPLCNTEYIRVAVNDHVTSNNDMFAILYNNGILERIKHHADNNNSILINCNQGIQRSSAVCACYLVKYLSFTPMKAINHIKSKRPIAFQDNINFLETIKKFNTKKYKNIKID